MDVDVIKASAPTVGEPRPSFAEEFQSYWERFPDKAFFFALLFVWCAVFQVFGTASFNFSSHAVFVPVDLQCVEHAGARFKPGKPGSVCGGHTIVDEAAGIG